VVNGALTAAPKTPKRIETPAATTRLANQKIAEALYWDIQNFPQIYADLQVFKRNTAKQTLADRFDREAHSPVRHVQQVQASTACNQKGTHYV
jgi:hypothetical protein